MAPPSQCSLSRCSLLILAAVTHPPPSPRHCEIDSCDVSQQLQFFLPRSLGCGGGIRAESPSPVPRPELYFLTL